jgi:DNA invertase Pin-like site-specific DNA recombinase
MLKAAVWSRVSTGEQSTENQVQALRDWAKNRGLEVVKVYSLEESAWNGRHRDKLNEALQDARTGVFSVLLVWSLDRLSREGIEQTLATMRQFRERGVQVRSHQEDWTDVPADLQPLLTSFFAWVAQQESKRRSERIKAGNERRRREGKPVGRQVGAKDRKRRARSGYFKRWEQVREAV